MLLLLVSILKVHAAAAVVVVAGAAVVIADGVVMAVKNAACWAHNCYLCCFLLE